MNTKYLSFGFLMAALLLALNYGHAQKLDVSEIEIELSKEAKKARKKGSFLNLGVYWNEDRTELYKVFVYQIKDAPKQYEIITFGENGEVKNKESGPLTANALSNYKLQPAGNLLENDGPDISNERYGYIRRSTLAGRPTVNVGHFDDRYYRDVWYGYKYNEDEDYKMEESFWPDFSFAVEGSSVQNTSSHLLEKRTALGKVLEGQRNYLPMEAKVVLGGLMATTEQNIYLTGIYDLANREWVTKNENSIEGKINQTGGSVEKSNQQGAYSLLVCDKGYLLLDIGPKGKILHKNWLDLENTQKKGVPEIWDLQLTENGGVFIFHSIADGYSTKKSDIALFEVKDGEVLNQAYIIYEEQDEKLIQAPKSQVKYKRVTGFMIDKLVKLPGGEFALLAHTHKPDVLNVIFHLDKGLKLKHLYTMDAVPHAMEKASEVAFAGFLPGKLYPAGDGKYYWLTRDIPGRLLPGIHVGPGSIKTTVTTTLRIDEVYAQFKLALVDFNSGSISKSFYPEKLLAVGEDPAELSKNGKLFMSAKGAKSGDFYNLIIQ